MVRRKKRCGKEGRGRDERRGGVGGGTHHVKIVGGKYIGVLVWRWVLTGLVALTVTTLTHSLTQHTPVITRNRTRKQKW